MPPNLGQCLQFSTAMVKRGLLWLGFNDQKAFFMEQQSQGQ